MTDPVDLPPGYGETIPTPLGWDPSDDEPPDDDEDYDPYEIEELRGDRALEMERG